MAALGKVGFGVTVFELLEGVFGWMLVAGLFSCCCGVEMAHEVHWSPSVNAISLIHCL